VLRIRLNKSNESLEANLFYFPGLKRVVTGKLNVRRTLRESAVDKISLSEVHKGKITLKLSFQK